MSKVYTFVCLAALVACSVADPKPDGCSDIGYGLMMDAGSTGSRVHVYTWCFMVRRCLHFH